QEIMFISNRREYEVSEVGVFAPKAREKESLIAGEVGFVVANVKVIQDAKVGDTLTDALRPSDTPLPGFKEIKPMVFSGIFPVDSADYESTRDALEKLRLNDSAFVYEPETSQALGFGFRCGYLGLLHMDIVQERLEREYGLNLITTAPSVVYKIVKKDGSEVRIDNPAKLPPEGEIEKFLEPMLRAHIYVPNEYVGAVLQLCQDRRGTQKDIKAAIGSRVIARETQKALRKNVLAKCYGGDISRKRKLLEKQKEGKKRMKAVGSVEIPQEAFLAVLKVEGCTRPRNAPRTLSSRSGTATPG